MAEQKDVSLPALQWPPRKPTPITTTPPVPIKAVVAKGKALAFAGFWRRLGALIVDTVLLSLAGGGVGFVLLFFKITTQELLLVFGPVVLGAWALLYFVFFEYSSLQGTLGKLVSGIKVTDLYGEEISFMQSIRRTFSRLLTVLTLGLGYLIIAVTPRKQALHDFAAKTLVVRMERSRFWIFVLILMFLASTPIVWVIQTDPVRAQLWLQEVQAYASSTYPLSLIVPPPQRSDGVPPPASVTPPPAVPSPGAAAQSSSKAGRKKSASSVSSTEVQEKVKKRDRTTM